MSLNLIDGYSIFLGNNTQFAPNKRLRQSMLNQTYVALLRQ